MSKELENLVIDEDEIELQESMTHKEIVDHMGDTAIDLDNLKPQKHLWVDRGAVMSCEGAAHANHRAFKRRR